MRKNLYLLFISLFFILGKGQILSEDLKSKNNSHKTWEKSNQFVGQNQSANALTFNPTMFEIHNSWDLDNLLNENCFFETPTNNFQNGYDINSQSIQIAYDFDVQPNTTFTVNQFEVNLFGFDVVQTMDLIIYENNNGFPGAEVTNLSSISVIEANNIGTAFGMPVYRYRIDLPSYISLEGAEGGSTYWISVTPTNFSGPAYLDATSNVNTTNFAAIGSPNNWNYIANFDGVFKVTGTCEEVQPACFFETPTNNFQNGYDINSQSIQIAYDFDVQSNTTFSVNEFEVNLFGLDAVQTMDLIVYENNNGFPGAEVTSFSNISVTEANNIGIAFGMPVYRYRIELPSNINLEGAEGGSTYWISVTPTNFSGPAYLDATSNVNTTNFAAIGSPNNWNYIANFDGVFKVSGTCEEVQPACFFETPTNNFQNGYDINSQSIQIAYDFDVQSNTTFSVNEFEVNLFGLDAVQTMDLIVYENNNGFPGAEVTSFSNISVTEANNIGTAFGMPVYRYRIELPSNIALEGAEGGSTYWISVTPTNFSGPAYLDATSNVNTTNFAAIGSPNNWNYIANFDGVFKVTGTCEEVQPACFFETPTNNFQNGYDINSQSIQIAYDFDVQSNTTFSVNEFEVNLFGLDAVQTMDLFVYENNNGFPGAEVSSFSNISVTEANNIGTAFGMPVYRYRIELPSNIALEGAEGGSTYWISVTPTNFSGPAYLDATSNVNTTNFAAIGSPNNWNYIANFDGVFKVSGTCDVPVIDEGDPCSQENLSDNFSNAHGLLNTDLIAHDFWVEGETAFNVQEFAFNILTNGETEDVTLTFYENFANKPGDIIMQYSNIIPSSKEIIGSAFGMNVERTTVELPTDLALSGGVGGKLYWVSATITNSSDSYWESTLFGNSYDGGYHSIDGEDWTKLSGAGRWSGIFKISGTCEDIEVVSCLEAPNGQYPDSVHTPACNGNVETIASNGSYGQYSMVNLTVPSSYTFSTDNPNDFITISNEAGTEALATGVGSLNWTAPYNGNFRIYTHVNENCEVSEGTVNRYMYCETDYFPANPDYPCFQGDGIIADGPEDGFNISGITTYRNADDFIVPADETFSVEYVRLNTLSNDEIQSVTLNFKENNNGSPGEIIESVTIVPTIKPLGIAFGLIYSELNLVLPNSIEFSEGTYWMEPVATSVNNSDLIYWESTSFGDNGAILQTSADGGNSWQANQLGHHGVFFIAGVCEVGEEEGCLEAPNGQFPFDPYTPACLGIQEIVTDLGWFGEYSEVMVTTGTEYIFSTDVNTAFITIGNAEGTEVLAYGTASITWTATTTGIIRFYTHENEDCLSSQNFVIRYVQCGEPVTISEPEFPCFFGDGLASNGPEDGLNVSTAINYATADDFTVEEQFNVQQIRLNILSVAEVTQTTLNIRTDNAGSPGTVLETVTMQPTESRIVGAAFGYLLHELTFDLPTPFVLAPGTYWLEPKVTNADNSDAIYWESSSTGNTGSISYQSLDNGSSWEPNQFGYQQIFFISGECEELGIGDFSDADFAYYPNPVDKILTIETKKSIENVSVYNLAGQSILSNLKMEANKINLAALPNGVYVFKVTLEGGQIETFKVIKK